ncbi:MAG: aspartyl/asparaginyl beta-hydroxylase domain-containing protein [Steroidobacteraceae bacterium]
MTGSVNQLALSAGRLADAGHWDEAEQIWLEIRRREPANSKALFSLAVHALKRGEAQRARELLQAARQAAPCDRLVLMTLCAACRHQGDPAGEREAIDAALALDPYFLPAMLAKAGWLERRGDTRAAADFYANCLKVAPPEPQWPGPLRTQLQHATRTVAEHIEQYDAYLRSQLGEAIAALPNALTGRWQEAASILAGRSRPYHSISNQLHIPRLPAVPFYERRLFDWVCQLESRTDAIREELVAAMQDVGGRFCPYISYQPGQPVNQWQELNHSDRWSTLHLWRSGLRVAENLDRCPQTARALAEIPLAEIDGLCPNAMYSVLAPHTRIPPHHGETNARLVAHLPLIVPPGCRYRVGFEEREWRVGEVLVFDDTLEHEARNDGDEARIVMIFDIWNPLLEPAERELVKSMAAAAKACAGPGAEPGR